MPPVSIAEIEAAQERIAGVAVRTPMVPWLASEIYGENSLFLKCENLQRTSSFKLRGAYNAIASLPNEERQRGVITYSSGNHGQAVACAASLLGVQAVVVMPEDAIPLKVRATERWGAAVVFAGYTSLHRQERAMELVHENGYTVIPPFDDRRIIAGQGTVGLEILEQGPDLDAVLVQVGGGGLVSGVATAIKALRPEITVIGVEPEGAADALASYRTGSIVTLETIETVADGLRTSRVGNLNFETIREAVDDIVTVSEDEILQTVGLLAVEGHLVAEPSGAVAPAAALFGHTGLNGARIAAVISGGNVDPERLQACISLANERTALV